MSILVLMDTFQTLLIIKIYRWCRRRGLLCSNWPISFCSSFRANASFSPESSPHSDQRIVSSLALSLGLQTSVYISSQWYPNFFKLRTSCLIFVCCRTTLSCWINVLIKISAVRRLFAVVSRIQVSPIRYRFSCFGENSVCQNLCCKQTIASLLDRLRNIRL